MVRALELIDPDADPWVLAEGLEAVARLIVLLDRAGSRAILDAAAGLRVLINQPIAPTESADLEWTLDQGQPAGRDLAQPLDPAAAHLLAGGYAREAARPAPLPPRKSRAPG